MVVDEDAVARRHRHVEPDLVGISRSLREQVAELVRKIVSTPADVVDTANLWLSPPKQ